jgi:DNA polymerase III epsilon subunit-like protein
VITCLVAPPASPHHISAWAREMLNPGTAVVLDTETSDLHGALIEVAIIDACKRAVLISTLVRPNCPIEPEAQRVHGISDEMVADVPPFRDVLPELIRVTAGRKLLAYNAAYDHAILVEQGLRSAVDIEHLAEPSRWECIMQARSDWLGRPHHRYPLGGNHRALGDAIAALNLLELIANETLRPPGPDHPSLETSHRRRPAVGPGQAAVPGGHDDSSR